LKLWNQEVARTSAEYAVMLPVDATMLRWAERASAKYEFGFIR